MPRIDMRSLLLYAFSREAMLNSSFPSRIAISCASWYQGYNDRRTAVAVIVKPLQHSFIQRCFVLHVLILK